MARSLSARYIEKFGTGTLMMIRQCTERGLPEPDFEQRGGEFVVTLWRDWLTEAVVERLGLNDRQRRAVALLKLRQRLDNKAYQDAFGVSKPTATRDLDELVSKRVLLKVGRTGRGTFYVMPRKGLTKGSARARRAQDADLHGRGNECRRVPAVCRIRRETEDERREARGGSSSRLPSIV